MAIKRGDNKRPVVNFGAAIEAKAISGDHGAARPRPFVKILQTGQIQDPGDRERPKSFYEGFDELKEAMKGYAEIDADGVGNHQNIIVVGMQAPYAVVAGRRRYAAAKALRLPVRCAVYPSLSEEQRELIQETENSARTSLAPSELVAKLSSAYKDGAGLTMARLGRIFAMGESTVRLYLGFAKNKDLVAELDRGLSVNEARALVKEYGEQAGEKAAELRRENKSETHAKAKAGRKAKGDGGSKPAVVVNVTEGKRAVLSFTEKDAKLKDLEKYHEALSAERERVGKLIKAWGKK